MQAKPCSCGSKNLILVVRETQVSCGLSALGSFHIKCQACGLRADEADFSTLRGTPEDVDLAIDRWNNRI
jgi:hypothetical protein